MTAEGLSENESLAWEEFKIPEHAGNNSKYFNLVEITANGNTVYGFIREGTGSLVIPVFSQSPHFFKNLMSKWNKSFLQSKDKRLFSPEEFCYAIGITETRNPVTSYESLLVGKYCMGPVTNWSEVGILIKSEKYIKCKPAEIAKTISAELNLKIQPITFSVLGVLK